MSKRLPLDSPNWTPLTEVHRFLCEQKGDRRFAAQDLTEAMANDRVRSMRRQVDRLLRRQAERELLPPSFWAEYELDGSSAELQVTGRRGLPLFESSDQLQVYERSGPAFIWIQLSGYVFYAWKPDCKKIFGLRVARCRTQRRRCTKSSKNQGVPRLLGGKNCARKSCVIAGETALTRP